MHVIRPARKRNRDCFVVQPIQLKTISDLNGFENLFCSLTISKWGSNSEQTIYKHVPIYLNPYFIQPLDNIFIANTRKATYFDG